MLKKIILILILCVLSSNIATSYTIKETKDVQGTGNYKLYRKLLNHDYSGLYQIYYKPLKDGGVDTIILSDFASKTDEPLTFYYGNKNITLTKKQWDYLFNDFSQIVKDAELLDKVIGEFYTNWISFYLDVSPKDVAEEYYYNQTARKKALAEFHAREKERTASYKTYSHKEGSPSDVIKSEREIAKKYPVATQLKKELNQLKTEKEYKTLQVEENDRLFSAMNQVNLIRPRISYDINGEILYTEAEVNWITSTQLEKMGINISHKNNTLILWNKDADKCAWKTYLDESQKTYRDSYGYEYYSTHNLKGVKFKYGGWSDYPNFVLKDLIVASVVNRFFTKDLNGNYIPMPYIEVSNTEKPIKRMTGKEKFQEVMRFLFTI